MKKMIIRILAIALVAVCLFSVVSCDKKDKTTTTTTAPTTTTTAPVTTTTEAPFDKAAALEAAIAVINSAAPATSNTTVVYTTQWGDKLESTYAIKADGTCDYTVQRFNDFDLSDPNAEFIITESGTTSATDETVPMGRINLQGAYIASYDAAKADGIVTLTVTLKNERISAFLTRMVEATDMTVTFVINAQDQLVSVSITYLTAENASVVMNTSYQY